MIEKLNVDNLNDCVELAHRLWPDAPKQELTDDFSGIMDDDNWACFLFRSGPDRYSGFIQMSVRRDYVEGCTSSPIAYVEGIYVLPKYRRKGIASKMIAAGEAWGLEKGCMEMASDCELGNLESIGFHTNLGFTEVNRVVCFAKKIRQKSKRSSR